jgi:2,5-diketo-D-gluconate reductase A
MCGARSASRTSSSPHLERIIAETGVTPAANQIELHPRLQQVGLRREHVRP